MGPRVLLGWCIVHVLLPPCFGDFYQQFTVDWGGENAVVTDSVSGVDLKLTQNIGCRFGSRNSYLFGAFSARIKLVHGNSAGTVCSFYLTSSGDKHDEIDFEFLGNVSGQPYVLHTNVFAHGKGEREQRLTLWFDPTEAYHNYSVIWNHHMIIWYVDDIPIRVYRNFENLYPNTYLNTAAQSVAGSIFDGSTWATRGGLIPTDWSYAPFVVNFKDFNVNACQVLNNDVTHCSNNYNGNWWEAAEYQTLDSKSVLKLRSINKHYKEYDYCTDKARNPTPPPECEYNAL